MKRRIIIVGSVVRACHFARPSVVHDAVVGLEVAVHHFVSVEVRHASCHIRQQGKPVIVVVIIFTIVIIIISDITTTITAAVSTSIVTLLMIIFTVS